MRQPPRTAASAFWSSDYPGYVVLSVNGTIQGHLPPEYALDLAKQLLDAADDAAERFEIN